MATVRDRFFEFKQLPPFGNGTTGVEILDDFSLLPVVDRNVIRIQYAGELIYFKISDSRVVGCPDHEEIDCLELRSGVFLRMTKQLKTALPSHSPFMERPPNYLMHNFTSKR